MTQKPEEGLLGWLDSPRLVFGAFAFFLLGMVALGVLIWHDRGKQVDRIDALVQAGILEERAAKDAQVEDCFSRAVQGPALRRVLEALELETMDPEARRHLREFRQLNALNTPTFRECRHLADDLNVPLPKGIR